MRGFWVALILPWLSFTVNAQVPQGWQVRSSHPTFSRLLAEGYARSETFRGLVVRLNESDVVVYVEPELAPRLGLRGYLMSDVVIGGGKRFLRIRLYPFGNVNTLIARLGHELQHAVEVADAPGVRDEDTFSQHFVRIGRVDCGATCYETDAAGQMQRAVARELRSR
jgi:hypothetical protein